MQDGTLSMLRKTALQQWDALKEGSLPWLVPITPSVLRPAGFITCLALEPLEFALLVFLPALSLPSVSLGNLPALSALMFLKEKKITETQT